MRLSFSLNYNKSYCKLHKHKFDQHLKKAQSLSNLSHFHIFLIWQKKSSEIFWTKLFGRVPPVIEELNDRFLKNRFLRQLHVHLKLFKPAGSKHHTIPVFSREFRVIVEPSIRSFWNWYLVTRWRLLLVSWTLIPLSQFTNRKSRLCSFSKWSLIKRWK